MQYFFDMKACINELKFSEILNFFSYLQVFNVCAEYAGPIERETQCFIWYYGG